MSNMAGSGMSDPQPDKSEVQFINKVVSIILASGMYATIGFYAIGLLLLFTKRAAIPQTANQYYHSFGDFLSGVLSFDPKVFLYIGTICLILTPVSRVVVSIFAFWREKDLKFVFVTTVVFLVILASIIIGSLFKINVG